MIRRRLDLGSFELDASGQHWVVDLGRDEYHLPGYLKDRTRHYRNKTISHNVLIFDGQDQAVDGKADIVAS